MICPYCGTHIADGLTICPACHADLTKAVPDASAIQTERYCKSCGALIPEGATVCPNCGMPVEEEAIQPAEKAAVQLQQQQEKPHLASAIPAASDPYSATTANERMPRRRVFLVSFIAALIVVGGAVLLITQPWNPDPYSLKATEAADTSMAGFPGERSKLASQDSDINDATKNGDQQIFEEVNNYYADLGDLKDKLYSSEQSLRDALDSRNPDYTQGYQTAQQDANDLSNLINKIQDIDTSTGTYNDDINNITTLGNWLRNWSDELMNAWAKANGGDTDKDDVLFGLDSAKRDDGKNSYQALFEQNYDSWKPQEKDSSDSDLGDSNDSDSNNSSDSGNSDSAGSDANNSN